MPYFVFHFFIGNYLNAVLGILFHSGECKEIGSCCFYFFERTASRIFYVNTVIVCTGSSVPFYAHGAVCVACFLKSDDIGNISVRRGWTYIPFISQNQVRVNLHLIKCIAGYWNGKGISGIKIFSYKFVGCRTLVYNLITCNGVWRVYSLHIEGISAGWCIGRFNLYLWIKRGTSHSTGRNRNAGWIQRCDFNNVSSSGF